MAVGCMKQSATRHFGCVNSSYFQKPAQNVFVYTVILHVKLFHKVPVTGLIWRPCSDCSYVMRLVNYRIIYVLLLILLLIN